MPIPDVLKRFAINLGATAAVNIIRGFLNEQIKDIEPSDLYDAICEDRDLWGATPDDTKQTGHRFKYKFSTLFDRYEAEITPELLLNWMKEDHPDLHSTIINTQNGVTWFEKQVYKIKQKIKEM